MKTRLCALLCAVLLVAGCESAPTPSAPDAPVRATALEAPAGPVADAFGDYWYQGVAELTSYDLEQARYGEIHDGHAVLIYVTEPFSKSKQVKVNDATEAGDDATTVLKLNATKQFNTGIYPYSIMTSIFAPIERRQFPHVLKVTTSVQEWCGHVFVQLNRTRRGYQLQQFSYFENDGDLDENLSAVALEDELWTTLRLNPDDLPTGTFALLPGTRYLRLSHGDWKPQTATATLESDGEGRMAYTLTYPDLHRTLTIRFNEAFPHEVEGWEESYPSGFGPDAAVLTTKATRKARTLQPYWQQNGVADEALRQELLGLAH